MVCLESLVRHGMTRRFKDQLEVCYLSHEKLSHSLMAMAIRCRKASDSDLKPRRVGNKRSHPDPHPVSCALDRSDSVTAIHRVLLVPQNQKSCL